MDKPFVFRTETSANSQAPPSAVYDVISDLRAHLIWSGERAPDKTFKLLSLEGSDGRATVGTEFTSTGANFNGIFRDRSVVTEAAPGKRFVISKIVINSGDRKHLHNLARLAEERAQA